MTHGKANAIVLPYVMEAFGKSAEKKLADLAELVSLKGIENATVEEKAKAFIQSLRDFNEKLAISDKIEELKKDDFPTLVDRALNEGNPTYPVPTIWGKEEFEEVLHRLLV